jgi:hypothetical protein
MSIITEIRELTGLSQARLAAWLAVSKSLVQFAERGERNLPARASEKLTLLIPPVQQLKDAAKTMKPGRQVYSNPVKLAMQHKQKMDFHERKAQEMQRKLDKLVFQHRQLTARLALLDIMKGMDTGVHKFSDRDKDWRAMMEWFGRERIPATGPEEQELLQDKIEYHQAYAAIHKRSWNKFELAGKK